MNIVIILLRAAHILAGALWVGSATLYLFYVEPAVKTLGPAQPKFMQDLIERRRYPIFMNTVSAITIIAGIALYWIASGGLQGAWIKTGPGLGYTIGSLVAIVVYGIGFFMIRPRVDRLGQLGKAIGQAGGPPTPAQAAELHKLEEEMTRIERVDVLLLTIAMLAMATARYWGF